MKYLLDVNVLVALTQSEHVHYLTVTRWFDSQAHDWGLCAFSEAGFLRTSINPNVGNLTVSDATQILAGLAERPGYRYWPINESWISLVEPFRERIYGHQQVADAFVLGLAVQANGVLVTLDKAFRHLAGPRYNKHLLVLE